MEFANLSLAYTAGILAVLAPCSLPMLPGFFSYFMDKEGKQSNLLSGLVFGLTTVAGLFRRASGVDLESVVQLLPESKNLPSERGKEPAEPAGRKGIPAGHCP